MSNGYIDFVMAEARKKHGKPIATPEAIHLYGHAWNELSAAEKEKWRRQRGGSETERKTKRQRSSNQRLQSIISIKSYAPPRPKFDRGRDPLVRWGYDYDSNEWTIRQHKDRANLQIHLDWDAVPGKNIVRLMEHEWILLTASETRRELALYTFSIQRGLISDRLLPFKAKQRKASVQALHQSFDETSNCGGFILVTQWNHRMALDALEKIQRREWEKHQLDLGLSPDKIVCLEDLVLVTKQMGVSSDGASDETLQEMDEKDGALRLASAAIDFFFRSIGLPTRLPSPRQTSPDSVNLNDSGLATSPQCVLETGNVGDAGGEKEVDNGVVQPMSTPPKMTGMEWMGDLMDPWASPPTLTSPPLPLDFSSHKLETPLLLDLSSDKLEEVLGQVFIKSPFPSLLLPTPVKVKSRPPPQRLPIAVVKARARSDMDGQVEGDTEMVDESQPVEEMSETARLLMNLTLEPGVWREEVEYGVPRLPPQQREIEWGSAATPRVGSSIGRGKVVQSINAHLPGF